MRDRYQPFLNLTGLESRACPSSIMAGEMPGTSIAEVSGLMNSGSEINDVVSETAEESSSADSMPMFMAMVMEPTTGMISENDSITSDSMQRVADTRRMKTMTAADQLRSPMNGGAVPMVPQAMQQAMPTMVRRTSGRILPQNDGMMANDEITNKDDDEQTDTPANGSGLEDLMPQEITPELEMKGDSARIEPSGETELSETAEPGIYQAAWASIVEYVCRIYDLVTPEADELTDVRIS